MQSPKYPFQTLTQAIDANMALGHHWFDRDALAFFDGMVHGSLDVRTQCFVSSERFKPMYGPAHSRRYTVRKMRDDGGVTTVGGFQAYATRAQAEAAIANLASARIVVRVSCSDGNHWVTSINASLQEAEAYFMGHRYERSDETIGAPVNRVELV